MFKITSFTALTVGLLLAVPLFLSDSEAGHGDDSDAMVAQFSERAAVSPIDAAFQLFIPWEAQASADLHTLPLGQDRPAGRTITVEQRDEARQTSVLIRLPATDFAAQ